MAALVLEWLLSGWGFFGLKAKWFLKIRAVINFNTGVNEKHIDREFEVRSKLVFL